MPLVRSTRSCTSLRRYSSSWARCTNLGRFGFDGFEPVHVLFEHLGLQKGIARIILGATEKEGPAILRQGRGIDGKQDQVAVLAEGVDQRAFFQLTGDGNEIDPG